MLSSLGSAPVPGEVTAWPGTGGDSGRGSHDASKLTRGRKPFVRQLTPGPDHLRSRGEDTARFMRQEFFTGSPPLERR